MRRFRHLALVLAATAALGLVVLHAETIRFEPTHGVPTFAVRPPVLRVKPGDSVETRTFSKPRDYYERAGGAWPGEVGPFHIEGATPQDTLVVTIVRLRPNRDSAVSAVNPGGSSAVAGDSGTRILNDPLPARRFVWQLDRTRNVGILDLPNSASQRIELPLRPMLGRVAVAPAGEEAWGGLWPGNFGGNMDASDVTHIMVAGSVRPLVDAFRIAQVELIEWLVADVGFDTLEADQGVSQGGTSRIANVVDPNDTVVAKFPKAALPPRVARP